MNCSEQSEEAVSTIFNTKFEQFSEENYPDEDDCIELFNEISSGAPILSINQFQEFLEEDNKVYPDHVIMNALEQLNHGSTTVITQELFSLLWFVCTCFDVLDCEQVEFVAYDDDKMLALTEEQYKAAMYDFGFDLTNEEITDIFDEFGIESRIRYEQFHSIIYALMRDIKTE